jgi:angiogenesis inhibitor 2
LPVVCERVPTIWTQFLSLFKLRGLLSALLGKRYLGTPPQDSSPLSIPAPVLFKEVNTCNPSTITGTLSRLSLDEDEEPKSCLVGPEGGLSFSPLPGNILVPMAASPGLGEPPPPQETNPVYMCGEGGLRQLDLTWLRPTEPGSEGDYMVLPRRTLSLQPGGGGTGSEEAPRARPEGTPRRAAKTVAHTEGYPSFLSMDHSGLGMGPAYGSLQNPYGMTFQPPPPTPSARQVPEPGERSRTMPRTVPGSTMKLGSLEVRGCRAWGEGLPTVHLRPYLSHRPQSGSDTVGNPKAACSARHW